VPLILIVSGVITGGDKTGPTPFIV